MVDRPGTDSRPAAAVREQAVRTEERHRLLDSRMDDYMRHRPSSRAVPDGPRPRPPVGGPDHGPRPPRVDARYYDRPDLIRHDYRHTYAYYDRYHRLHHRVIWPSYYYPVCYRFGHDAYFWHVYPYYHRKYVFISLGGWWPGDYSYVRYYWYGYHPYVWYGYYPIAYQVPSDNDNYYTYNYYYQNDSGEYANVGSATTTQPVDTSTWADVRSKLDEQNVPPASATPADTRFEEGVKSFEGGNYSAAAGKFEEAMRLSPDDVILPFAYAQALFADGKYTESAEQLRKALRVASPEKEGVFYPRGLYANDDVLFAQIGKLTEKIDEFGYDADMQLLLGYHLLGVGETGYAREPLENAGQDLKNAESARVLLKVLDKVEKEAGATGKSGGAAAEAIGVAVGGDVQTKATASAEPNAVTSPADAQPLNISDVPAGVQPQGESTSDKTPGEANEAIVPTPSSDEKDDAASPVVPPGDGNASSESLESSGDAASVLANLPARAIAGVGRCLRADFAIFAAIVLLAWAGVCLQWRFFNDRA